MTLTLSFPPDVEAKLRERAAAAGTDVAAVVQEAVNHALQAGNTNMPSKSSEERIREFDQWVASHKPVAHFVDDSRESIYSGRGE